MKALLQRVTRASVRVDGETAGEIGPGLVVLVGVAQGDTEEDASYLVNKIVSLRIFDDSQGLFNLSAQDVQASFLIVSQFTLMASTRKGRRPSFANAATPEVAERLFNYFVEQARATGLKVETGKFRRQMLVEILNDGPVTVLLDSEERRLPRRGSS
ncbi:MAG: D-tyrosyl-tRNA(Tyr) deacylase [Chloroflexi bacterium]|nr:D-tyrosyl-tRNA(Tyr) deacylase [Chloroflexota bacterium]